MPSRFEDTTSNECRQCGAACNHDVCTACARETEDRCFTCGAFSGPHREECDDCIAEARSASCEFCDGPVPCGSYLCAQGATAALKAEAAE